MMKKITLFLFLLVASMGYAQQEVSQDFEDGGFNGDPFGGMTSATIVDDPATGGTNGKVAELISSATGNTWQGINITLNKFVDLSADKTMTIDVYSTAAASILLKVNGGVDGAPEAAAEVDHTGSGWETLTMTFDKVRDGKAIANGVYGAFVIHTNWDTAAVNFQDPPVARTIYVDNIAGTVVAAPETCSDGIMNNGETAIDCGGPNCDACPSPPTTAAPTPPARNTGDVVSLYSDAYSDFASNFDTGWCGNNSVTEVMIEGNATIQYNGNNCQGITLPNAIDITSYTHMHVDVYIQAGVDVTSKVFNLKFVGVPNSIFKEYPFNAGSSPALVAGSWISIDVAVDLSTMSSFKEFGITADNLKNQVWYDNLYFYRAATASVSDNELLNVSMYPNPASDRLNISAASTIKNVSVFNVLGKKVMSLEINKNSEAIDVSKLASGIYLIKYQLDTATGTAKFIKE